MRAPIALSVLPFLAAVLPAQCLDTGGGSPISLVPYTMIPPHDEGRSTPIDMQFGAGGFPMAGAVGALTHATIDANGVLYLTSGLPPIGTVDFGALTVDDLRGQPGDAPRVFGLWEDLAGPAPTWTVTVDTSQPGRFAVRWIDVEESFSGGPRFSFSVTLHASGVVELSYGALPTFLYGFAGVSIGNGVGTGMETSVDLAAGQDSGGIGLLFQMADSVTTPSFANRTITLLPNGSGGYTSALTCDSGAHTTYGAGCYGESVYEYFADASAARNALEGNALVFTPTAGGYAASFVPGGAATLFLPPSGAATALAPSDDGSTTIVPSAPLPVPGGAVPSLTIEHNGVVCVGPDHNHVNDWTPSGDDVAAATYAAFYSWHDYNDTEFGSGAIETEERLVGADTVLVVTWNGVESYSNPPLANPSTFQFQFDLTTGAVTIVWQQIDPDATSLSGSAHLVGYSGPGAGADPGSLPFASVGGTTVLHGANALTLRASPMPRILTTGGSNPIDYTLDGMPDFAPPSGARVGILFFSVAGVPGVDLGVIGAPGCQAYVVSLDVSFPIAVLGGTSQTVTVTFVPPLTPGLSFFAQAAALFPAGSYPGGLNAFGAVTSNGVETRF